MREILVLVDYRNLYRQGRTRSEGIDLESFIIHLKEHHFTCEIIDYDKLINGKLYLEIKDKIIFYTSSQSEVYRSFIDDIVYLLSKNNLLLPRYDLIKAHENKCYQELLLSSLNIVHLESKIFSTYTDVSRHVDDFTYPVILKRATGSGSISVYKINSKKELLEKTRKLNRGYEFYYNKIKCIYKKFKGKDINELKKDDFYIGRIQIQNYIPNLTDDWKILIFGDKYYALNRRVRKNDFRASGSGLFSYLTPPKELLDYAKQMYAALDLPFVSLDLCISEDKSVSLIEFQGLHFGPITLLDSDSFYVYDESAWQEIKGKSDLSLEYANSIVNYIKRKGL